MSVNSSVSLVTWDVFLEKNELASDTENLLFEGGDEFLTEPTAEGDGGDAWEATDVYNGIRGELPEDLLNTCDRCFSACFWNPVQDDLDNLGSPPVSPQAAFGIVEADFKGQRLYAESLISPSTVASLSKEGQSVPIESLALALNSAFEGEDWQECHEYFESPDEWIRYANEWKAIFEEAAKHGRGLLFRVG